MNFDEEFYQHTEDPIPPILCTPHTLYCCCLAAGGRRSVHTRKIPAGHSFLHLHCTHLTRGGRSVYLCSLANTEADRPEYEYPHRAIIDRDYCVITHLNEKE